MVWTCKACDTRSEFPVSSPHESIKEKHINKYREDIEVRWVTNLSEDRKGFYLITTQLDPHTNFLTFRDNKYFPTRGKTRVTVFL